MLKSAAIKDWWAFMPSLMYREHQRLQHKQGHDTCLAVTLICCTLTACSLRLAGAGESSGAGVSPGAGVSFAAGDSGQRLGSLEQSSGSGGAHRLGSSTQSSADTGASANGSEAGATDAFRRAASQAVNESAVTTPLVTREVKSRADALLNSADVCMRASAMTRSCTQVFAVKGRLRFATLRCHKIQCIVNHSYGCMFIAAEAD